MMIVISGSSITLCAGVFLRRNLLLITITFVTQLLLMMLQLLLLPRLILLSLSRWRFTQTLLERKQRWFSNSTLRGGDEGQVQETSKARCLTLTAHRSSLSFYRD